MELDRLAWDDLRLVGAVAETGTSGRARRM